MNWISVTERLPERGVDVLVAVKENTGMAVELDQLFDNNGTWLIFRDELITHWMPLPEPPKETP